jgi:hypothetical protein
VDPSRTTVSACDDSGARFWRQSPKPRDPPRHMRMQGRNRDRAQLPDLPANNSIAILIPNAYFRDSFIRRFQYLVAGIVKSARRN